MRGDGRSTLRASWLATALATALAFTTPAVAQLAGTRAGALPIRGTAAARPMADDARIVRSGRPPSPSARVSRASSQEQAPAEEKPQPHLLVHATGGLVARKNPWTGAPAVGTVASVSRYYHVPLVLWVEEVSKNGSWGLVDLPYAWPRREGWIPLKGVQTETTWITVEVDLSERLVRVFKRDELLYKVSGAIGTTVSPTPTGDYVVSDRVPFAAGSYYGTFAFGISGIQPNLPPGWSGGDQLAIHGTNNPGSIGQRASAGCIRVSEWALGKLKPLLRLGTPVLIRP